MRYAEGRVLTDALSNSENSELLPASVSHSWVNSRQVAIDDIYTMDIATCFQINNKSKTQRPTRALAINAHSQQ